MATQKFSELTTTSTPNSASVFAIAYSGTSYGVTLANIAANLPAVTATSLTSSGTLTVSGNTTISGDLTIGGDDLFMNTNTSGAALIADGTNFNPVVISGDIAIATGGAATIQADAVEGSMLNDNVISGQTEITSGLADADELLYSDAGVLKKVGMDTAKTYFSSTPTAITVADESTDTSCFPLFVTAATGDLGPKTASGLTFNSNTDVLSGTFSGNITGNVTGNTSGSSGSCTGNAATATALASARTIGGVSFDGTGNINLPGVNTAGNQDTSGTAAVATAVTITDNESTDEDNAIVFTSGGDVDGGNLGLESDGNCTYNPSTGSITATGFIGALTGNASGSSGSCTGNAATATALASARTIGGVSFDGTGNINLPGVNTAGNQNTSGTAAVATTVTITDNESTDEDNALVFTSGGDVDGGNLGLESDGNCTYNPSTGSITATGFIGALTGNASGSSGSCTGNAATATALASARTIGGVSFDGTGNIDLPGVNTAGNQNTSGTAAGLSATLATSSGGTGLTGNVVGKQTMWIPAGAMYPNTTAGCAALAQVELSNGPEIKVLDFDASSDEHAQFTVAFPKLWNEGTVTFQAFWTVTGTNTGTVAWGLSAVAFADNGDQNTAFGTNVVATAKAHSGTSNDLDVSAESGAVTIAGSPGVDELCYFQIMRDVSADDQSGDARLLGIKLFYTTDALTDT
jgi:hypothetical protein